VYLKKGGPKTEIESSQQSIQPVFSERTLILD
jgi:hypothetical protein